MRNRILALLLCMCTLLTLLPFHSFATDANEAATPLSITKQPENVSAPAGEVVTVTVEAEGDGLQYQWYLKNPDMKAYSKSSLTGNTYTWTMTEKNAGRMVYCVITDAYGNSLKTQSVTLDLPAPVRITGQPVSVNAPAGEQVTVTVEAEGYGLQYQWYLKNPSMTAFSKSSVTENTYSWTVTEANAGRKVYCVVSDHYGRSVKSNTVILTLPSNLEITRQPQNAAASEGAVVTTAVTAEGEDLQYQWYYKNLTQSQFYKSSLKTNTYSWKITAKDSGRQVYCVIWDAFGNEVTTDTVTLKIPQPLKITKQPANVLTKIGTEGKTTVAATGEGLTYQWFMKNPGMSAYAKSSVTDATYTWTLTKENAGRTVYCIVTDMYGKQVRTNTVTFAAASAKFGSTLYKVKNGGTKAPDLIITSSDTEKEILWSSSNTAIAKVNSKGVITGVKNGTATITARGTTTGFVASCTVKVCNLKQIAITFDDGPGKRTGELLDFLKENDIKVTFFLLGNRMSSKRSIIQRQIAEGHEVGYHSYSHDYQPNLSSAQLKSDFKKANDMMKSFTGEGFTLWRSPYGGYNQRVLDCIPLPHILWSVDTRDWDTLNATKVYNSIKNNAKDGAIILLHDIHSTTVTGAMRALKELKNGDYEFLTVTELLSRNGKSPKAGVTYSRG